jgi:hypothetical protein
MELNGTHQFLICADDVIVMGKNINAIHSNTEALLEASRMVDLEVQNREDTDYGCVLSPKCRRKP